MHRGAIVSVMIGVLALGACGPSGPSAEELEQMRQDSIAAAQARQDSIEAAEAARRRAAEQARQDSIRRAREEQARLEREARRAREILAEKVYFDYDKSELTDQAREVLQRKIGVLRANDDVRLRIEGHADERGSVEYNLALGKRRAESVKSFIAGYGLDASRFETVTYGEERPARAGHDESAWAMNRRAEFVIVAGGDMLRAPVSQ